MELNIKNKGLYNFISLFPEKERKDVVEKLCLIGIEHLFQIHPSTKWTREKIIREYNILYYENRCKVSENLIKNNISRNFLKPTIKSNESNLYLTNSIDSEQQQLKSPNKIKNDDDLKKSMISSQSIPNYHIPSYKENLINKYIEKSKRENSIRKRYKSRSHARNLSNNDQYELLSSSCSNINKNYKNFSVDNNFEKKINKNNELNKRYINEDIENVEINENKGIYNLMDIDQNSEVRSGQNSRNQNDFNCYNNNKYYSFDKNDEDKSNNDKYNKFSRNEDYLDSNPYMVNDFNDNNYKIIKEESINKPKNIIYKNNYIRDKNSYNNYKRIEVKNNYLRNNFLKKSSSMNYNYPLNLNYGTQLSNKELQGSINYYYGINNPLENREKQFNNDMYKIINRNID